MEVVAFLVLKFWIIINSSHLVRSLQPFCMQFWKIYSSLGTIQNPWIVSKKEKKSLTQETYRVFVHGEAGGTILIQLAGILKILWINLEKRWKNTYEKTFGKMIASLITRKRSNNVKKNKSNINQQSTYTLSSKEQSEKATLRPPRAPLRIGLRQQMMSCSVMGVKRMETKSLGKFGSIYKIFVRSGSSMSLGNW